MPKVMNSLPPFLGWIERLVLLLDMADGEVIVQPIGLIRLDVCQSQSIRVLVQTQSPAQPTDHQLHYILESVKLLILSTGETYF